MTYSGFEAATADFAAAAPRFEQAADGLAAALGRTVDELEGRGSFWGADGDFEHGYRADWSEAAELAAACERALRAMAEQLAGTSASYARTEEANAESFSTLHARLAAILDPDGVGR
ncbi:MAG TPA: hypothetical protein VFN97_15050 [Actinospica sp.]|nr:hypothetical protein [Actinospica sp.]